MPNLEKKIDNRKFGEIYCGLSRLDARSFRDEIASRGLTYTAIFRWQKGDRLPQRRSVQAIIESFDAIGIVTTAKTLFPD